MLLVSLQLTDIASMFLPVSLPARIAGVISSQDTSGCAISIIFQGTTGDFYHILSDSKNCIN
jgi:hypothetical protein